MKNSPLIIFNIEAHQKYNSYDRNIGVQKRSAFYRCVNPNSNIADYFSRANAVEKETFETVEAMEQIISQTQASQKDILGYAKDRPGSTGLWNKDGDITDKKVVKEIKDKLSKTDSTVWSGVLSFTPDFAAKRVGNKHEAHALLSNTINGFFKDAKLDPDNMNWFAAYHVNTDNPHCHILFWEENPNTLHADGTVTYSKWKLPKKALTNFSYRVVNYFNKELDLESMKFRDVARDNLRYNLHRKEFEKDLTDLAYELEDVESFQYARISKENQKKVDAFLNKLIASNPELKEQDLKYKNLLQEQQKRMIKIYEDNHMAVPEKTRNFTASRISEYYSRLGNEILKSVKYFEERKQEIYEIKHRTDEENNELQTRFEKLASSYEKGVENNLSVNQCLEILKERNVELKGRQSVLNFENEEEKHNYYKQTMKQMNPLSASSQILDRSVLNEYGIDYISKSTNKKSVTSKGKTHVFTGDYTKYTFVNHEGKTREYTLSNTYDIQHSFSNVLKDLGLNNLDLLNLAVKFEKDSLGHKLLTQTGHFSLDWYKKESSASATEQEYKDFITPSKKEERDLKQLQSKLLPPNKETLNKEIKECVRNLKKQGVSFNKEQYEGGQTQMYMKRMNPLSASSQILDRSVLNEYGIDYIVSNTSNKIILSQSGNYVKYHGDYKKYTFINHKGKTETFTLANKETFQNSFPAVLKKLGLNNIDLLNMATKFKKDSLGFNLLTQTGTFNINNFGIYKTPKNVKTTKYESSKGQNGRLIYLNKSLNNFFNVQLDRSILALLNSVNDDMNKYIKTALRENQEEMEDNIYEQG